MLRNLFILAILLCIASSASAAMIGYWKFDDAANLGKNEVGQSSSNVWGGVTQGIGISGGSMSLTDGTGRIFYGEGALTHALASPQITFDFYVKGDPSKGFLTREGLAFSAQQGVWWGDAWDFLGTFVPQAGTGAIPWLANLDPTLSYYNQVIAWTAPGTFEAMANNWVHVRMTNDRISGLSTLKIGNLPMLTALGQTGYFGDTIKYFAIGSRTWGADSFAGEIDEFRIYNTPEPATLALLGLGGLFLRRRK